MTSWAGSASGGNDGRVNGDGPKPSASARKRRGVSNLWLALGLAAVCLSMLAASQANNFETTVQLDSPAGATALPASIAADEAELDSVANETKAADANPNDTYHVPDLSTPSALQAYAIANETGLSPVFNSFSPQMWTMAAEPIDELFSDGKSASGIQTELFGLSGRDWAIVGDILGGIAVAVGCVASIAAGVPWICAFLVLVYVALVIVSLALLSEITAQATQIYGVAWAYLNESADAYYNTAVGVESWLVSTDNDAGLAWDSQAEAAAVTQLGNGTFDPALDLIQSNVSAELAAYEATVFSSTALTSYEVLNDFANNFTGSNPGCGVNVEGIRQLGNSFDFNSPAYSTYCGYAAASTPAALGNVTYAQAWPTVSSCSSISGLQDDSSDLLFVGNGSYVYTDGGNAVSFYSLAGHEVWGYSGGTEGAAFGAPSGAYVPCDPEGSDANQVYLQNSFPLNDPTEAANYDADTDGQTNPEVDLWLWNNSALSSNEQTGCLTEDGGSGCEYPTAFNQLSIDGSGDRDACVSIYAEYLVSAGTPQSSTLCDGSQSTQMVNLTYSLYGAARTATNFAEAYWAFLRYLGYTSAADIPTNCLIATPSQAIPPGIGLTQLETMSVLQILVAYESYFAIFNATFGGAIPPGDMWVCGNLIPLIPCPVYTNGTVESYDNQSIRTDLVDSNYPSDPGWWECSFDVGSDGIGYAYISNLDQNASGAIWGSTLADAQTWLGQGLITITTPSYSIGPVPLNTTFMLPAENYGGLIGMYVQRLVNASNGPSSTSFADPAACLNAGPVLNGTEIGDCYPSASIFSDQDAWGLAHNAHGYSPWPTMNWTWIDGSSVNGPVVTGLYLIGCVQVVSGGPIWYVSYGVNKSGCEFGTYIWNWGPSPCSGSGCRVNSSGCSVSCPPPPGGGSFCTTFFIVDDFTDYIGNLFGGVSGGLLKGLGQVIGCIVGVLVLVTMGVVLAWLCYWAVLNRPRRHGD